MQPRNPASTDKIRQAIDNSQMTSREISRRLEVTEQTISAWRTGWRKPSPNRLVRLARLLEVNVRDLTEEEDREASRLHSLIDDDITAAHLAELRKEIA